MLETPPSPASVNSMERPSNWVYFLSMLSRAGLGVSLCNLAADSS